MSLKEYGRKRKFHKTPEPPPRKPKRSSAKSPLRFVVQKHAATRDHYDFRLEVDGVLKSWAVPKGPTLRSGDPRLAVHVEDHPIDYGDFEGVIPKGNYGAGTVMVWDYGTFFERSSSSRQESEKRLLEGLARGHITFILEGSKLRGEFALVKVKKKGTEGNVWLLIKKHDAFASRQDPTSALDRSALTGRTMEVIAREAAKKGEIWLPGKGRQSESKPPLKKILLPIASKKSITAKPSEMPHRVRPMEPLYAIHAPAEKKWLYEPLGQGIRAVAEIEPNKVKLYSRAFLPLEAKYREIVRALRKLGGPLILDGEIIVDKESQVYQVSDILYLKGKDLRELGLQERKALLKKIKLTPPLTVAPSAREVGQLHLAPFSKVVAKKLDSSYRSGLSRDWLRFRLPRRGKALPTSASLPNDETPPVSHPDKVFWPEEKYTKGDLIKYYDRVSSYILPYLIDRPQSLHRQPDGIRHEGFFHKDMTSYLPKRVKTFRVFSGSSGRTINYALCQDRWSLLYLINLGCIELNPWLSRIENLEKPDLVVIDLDPDDNSFEEVIKVAREVHSILRAVKAESFCKTSGSTGLHICIPTQGKYEYELGRQFAELVCKIVNQKFPAFTSVERNPAKRRGKIYLDFMQNRRGQTLAAPYCVRPKPGATVSTPLKWSEVKKGLRPEFFTIKNVPQRLAKVGDLWRPMQSVRVDLEACMKRLLKRYHK